MNIFENKILLEELNHHLLEYNMSICKNSNDKYVIEKVVEEDVVFDFVMKKILRTRSLIIQNHLDNFNGIYLYENRKSLITLIIKKIIDISIKLDDLDKEVLLTELPIILKIPHESKIADRVLNFFRVNKNFFNGTLLESNTLTLDTLIENEHFMRYFKTFSEMDITNYLVYSTYIMDLEIIENVDYIVLTRWLKRCNIFNENWLFDYPELQREIEKADFVVNHDIVKLFNKDVDAILSLVQYFNNEDLVWKLHGGYVLNYRELYDEIYYRQNYK